MAKKKTSKKKTAKKKVVAKKAAAKKTAGKKTLKAKSVAKKMRPAKKGPAKKAKSPKKSLTAKKVAPLEVESPLLAVGTIAPDFTIPNEAQEPIRLSDFRGKKVILYFYPKDHTPGCTTESCDFRDYHREFDAIGAVIFGVSKDSVRSHESFRAKQSLPFSLLSDEKGNVCELYGVWQKKSMYGREYMGIARTTYVIDEAGKVEKVYPKVSVTDHVKTVLRELNSEKAQAVSHQK